MNITDALVRCDIAPLLKAIERYTEKEKRKLKAELKKLGYIDADTIVEHIENLEELIAQALEEEKKLAVSQTKKHFDAGNDDCIDTILSNIDRKDKLAEKVQESVSSCISEVIPEIADKSIKIIDSGLSISSKTLTKRTTEWVTTWSEELGKLMKLSGHNKIKKVLAHSLRVGDSVEKVTRRLQREYHFSRDRARKTAVTEMLTAHEVARDEGRMQNPSVDRKRWRHTGPHKNTPRPWHQKMNGQIVTKDKAFVINGPKGKYEAMFPREVSLPASERINCHCIAEDVVNEKVLGYSLEERKRMQAEARASLDAEWEKEFNARNKAKAGITVNPKPSESLEKLGKKRYNKAVSAEPEITNEIVNVAEKVKAKVEGLEFRLKSPESYARKLALNPRAEINDIIRYTYTAPAKSYTKTIHSSLRQFSKDGYETIKVKNYWLNADNPYNGVNTFIKAPNGQIFEMQYHTPESYMLKQGPLHHLYEKQRDITNKQSKEYIKLQDEMLKLSSALKTPKGIDEVN